MNETATITLKSGKRLSFRRSNRSIYRLARCPEVGNGPQSGIAHVINLAWSHCLDMGANTTPEDLIELIEDTEDWTAIGTLPEKLGYLTDTKKKTPAKKERVKKSRSRGSS